MTVPFEDLARNGLFKVLPDLDEEQYARPLQKSVDMLRFARFGQKLQYYPVVLQGLDCSHYALVADGSCQYLSSVLL